jgi:integrase/recombinase XerD
VEYLQNEGDIFTLQMILGHSSLDMIRHYQQLAKTDTKNAHRRASPADKVEIVTGKNMAMWFPNPILIAY